MTEAELWDQFVQWMIAGGDSLGTYISILFAFLIMAHFIGKKLTRTQATIACALLFWATCIMIYAVAGYFYRAQMFMDRLLEFDPNRHFFLSTFAIIAIALMMIVGFFVSIYFLIHVRRNEKDRL